MEGFRRFVQHWTTIAASTASAFRMVSIPGYLAGSPVAGTSAAATVSAVGAAATGAVPVITMVGVWVALGPGYYEARNSRKAAARCRVRTGLRDGRAGVDVATSGESLRQAQRGL